MKLALLATLLFMCGCGGFGTGTGNPFNDHASAGIELRLASLEIAAKACEKIHSCHAIPAHVRCIDAVRSQFTFAAKLGLIGEPYPKLQEIVEREFRRMLSPNWRAAETCKEATSALLCNDPDVRAAYDPTAEDPFAGVAGLLPTSCADTFKPAP